MKKSLFILLLLFLAGLNTLQAQNLDEVRYKGVNGLSITYAPLSYFRNFSPISNENNWIINNSEMNQDIRYQGSLINLVYSRESQHLGVSIDLGYGRLSSKKFSFISEPKVDLDISELFNKINISDMSLYKLATTISFNITPGSRFQLPLYLGISTFYLRNYYQAEANQLRFGIISKAQARFYISNKWALVSNFTYDILSKSKIEEEKGISPNTHIFTIDCGLLFNF